MDREHHLKESDHAFGYTSLLPPGHIVVVLPGEVGESNLSTQGEAKDHVAPTSY